MAYGDTIMTKAVDIQTAILKALSDEGLAPANVSFIPAADDSAALAFTVETALRHVGFSVAIPPAPQRVLAPGWGCSYFGQDSTAQINANMGPYGGVVVKRYPWAKLEAAEGVYTMGAIGQADTIIDDLEQTRVWNIANPTRKRQMVFMIEDKSFGSPQPSMLPLYLRTEKWNDPVYSSGLPAVGYEYPNDNNIAPGTTALRWVPRVVNRMNALTAYMASKFDALDEYGGVAFMETAHGLPAATQRRFGYTAQRYADSYKAVLAAASTTHMQSRVFWLFNFLSGGQELLLEIGKAIAGFPNKNVYAGGPDLLPETDSLTRPGMAYSIYPQLAALGVKLFIQLSPPGYSVLHSTGNPGRFWTFQELHAYARDVLKCSFILAVPTNNGHFKYNAGTAGDLVKLIPNLPLS